MGNIATPDEFAEIVRAKTLEFGYDDDICRLVQLDLMCKMLIELGYRDAIAIVEESERLAKGY